MTLEEKNAAHLKILNEEMGAVRDEMRQTRETLIVVKNDVSWLKRFFWIIATASIGSLVGSLIQLVR